MVVRDLARVTGAGMNLNVVTRTFPENKTAGLTICGLEWGDPDADVGSEQELSFFSDKNGAGARSKYRRAILKWFQAWGHPLATTWDIAGPFERSIVQTNWLPSEAKNTEGRDIRAECLRHWNNFENHIRTFRPKLLMFMSVQLLDVLNSQECIDRARVLFGKEDCRIPLKPPSNVTSGGRSPRVALQVIGSTEIIALPHPTPRFNPPELQYMAAFRDQISPVISRYRQARGF